MEKTLDGRKIAILATDGFEQVELFEPKKALEEAGAHTEIVSLQEGDIKGWDHTDWGDSIRVERLVGNARPEGYDGLVLPGGVMNPDKLRADAGAVAFVKSFVESGKPVAAICHGPWTLIEAGVVKGRTLTSWPSLKTDLQNAGANWVDEQVKIDGNIITSRKPDDIPAFNGALIAMVQTVKKEDAEQQDADPKALLDKALQDHDQKQKEIDQKNQKQEEIEQKEEKAA